MSSSNKDFKASDQVHVDIRDDLSIKTFGRPPTNLGAQGSHTSAYHLIEMLAISLQQYSGIEEAMKRIFSFFSDLQGNLEIEETLVQKLNIQVTEEKRDDITQYRQQIKKIRNELNIILLTSNRKMDDCLSEIQQNSKYAEDIKRLIRANNQAKNPVLSNLPDPETLCKAIDQKFSDNNYKDVIEELIRVYLTVRNKIPYTAFPTEGNLETISNEGSLIKLSCSKLAKLDGHMGMNPKIKYSAEEIDKLSDSVAQQMLNLFWFPRISKEKLIDLTVSEDKQLWDKISAAKNYKIGSVPRSNDLNILRDVIYPSYLKMRTLDVHLAANLT